MSDFFGHLSGVITAVLMLTFVGIVLWAWSGRRRAAYEAASRLPLEEDPAIAATTSNRERLP
ncbi:MAG: cbb3-type cytochrome c oxidase subunit 3 [Steroidobacteraceae bacterium]